MNEIIEITGKTEIARQEVTSYFPDFVAWIDRPAKTTRTYLNNLRQFAAWMYDNGIKQPIRQDVINYRQFLQDTGKKPSTIKAYLQTVKAFFSWTAAAGIYPNIASNIHAPNVKQDIHKKEALKAADVAAIEESITEKAAERQQEAREAAKDSKGRQQRATEQGKRMQAIYLLAVSCGLRTVEISRLNVKDFTTKGGEAWIYVHGKGHTEADARKAVPQEAAEAVKDYLKSRKDKPTANSPLFVSTGNRSGGKRIAETTISTMIKKAMKEAGYDDERLTAHSLRHTAGTTAMQLTGNNIYETQKYMRHTSPKTTEIYLHTNDNEESERRIADSIYKFYHGQSEESGLDALLKKANAAQRKQIEMFAAAVMA